MFISLNVPPTKSVDLCNSPDCQLEDISEFLVNQKVSFCCQESQLPLSQAGERGCCCWAGIRVGRPACWSGLCQLLMRDRMEADRFWSLRPQFPPLQNGWCACVGTTLLDEHPSPPPVSKFWNLIFLSPTSLSSLQPPPYLPPPPHPMISVSPVNQAKSAQGRDCGEKTSLRSWQMTIF